MHSKLPHCMPNRGFLSIRRMVASLAGLGLMAVMVTGVEAKPGSFHSVAKTPLLTKVQPHTKLTVAASQGYGEVSDAPPAYIDGVFINLPKEEKTVPFWMALWNPSKKSETSALPGPATRVVSRSNLNESLVRMAILYRAIASE